MLFIKYIYILNFTLFTTVWRSYLFCWNLYLLVLIFFFLLRFVCLIQYVVYTLWKQFSQLISTHKWILIPATIWLCWIDGIFGHWTFHILAHLSRNILDSRIFLSIVIWNFSHSSWSVFRNSNVDGWRVPNAKKSMGPTNASIELNLFIFNKWLFCDYFFIK